MSTKNQTKSVAAAIQPPPAFQPNYAPSTETNRVFHKKGKLAEVMAIDVRDCADADLLPDQLSFKYVFDFPAQEAALRDLFRTDANLTNLQQFQNAGRINTATTGVNLYSVKCSFLACAVCLQMDVDPYVGSVQGVIVASDQGAPTPAIAGGSQAGDGTTIQNAVLTIGYLPVRVRDILFKLLGVRVEFGCDNILANVPLQVMGLRGGNGVDPGASTLLPATPYINQANRGLALDGRQFLTDTADPGCGVDGTCPDGLARPPVVPFASSVGQYDGTFKGCLPLPQVMVCPGMMIDFILYPQPGLESLQQELLDILSPSASRSVKQSDVFGDRVVARSGRVVLDPNYAGSATITAGPCADTDTVTVAPGEAFPRNLLAWNSDGSATPRFGAIVLTPTSGAPVTIPAGTTIDNAAISVTTTEVDLGSAAESIIHVGRIVLTLSFKGAYISKNDCVNYFRNYAVKSAKLREMYLGTQAAMTIMNAHVLQMARSGQLEGVDSAAGITGVAGLPEVRKALENSDPEALSARHSPPRGRAS